MMTSTTKTMVLLIAIMMLADKINTAIYNAGCNQRNTCRRNSGREISLYDAAMSGNLPNVTTLLNSTYVDPTPYAGSLTPLLVAGKTFLFSSSDPDPDIKSK
jgi:hypothetical protein